MAGLVGVRSNAKPFLEEYHLGGEFQIHLSCVSSALLTLLIIRLSSCTLRLARDIGPDFRWCAIA